MSRRTSLILIAIVLAALWFSGCAQKAPEKPLKQPFPKPSGQAGQAFVLKSSAFEEGQKIPLKYTNTNVTGGENVSIPFSWENPPDGTKSFAIVIVDRHPMAENYIHWLVINIPGNVTSLPEGASGTDKMPSGSKELNSTTGSKGYSGPQPPPGSGTHDYETTIYALGMKSLDLNPDTSLSDFLTAIDGKVLASTKLTGKFSR